MTWFVPLEWLYRSVILLRNCLYDFHIFKIRRLPGKVISIGNIAVGGTGKSPLVKEVVKQLQGQGFHPAILTRGYKSGLRPGEWQILLNGSVAGGVDRASVRADEARMQSLALPGVHVVVGADRYAAAKIFTENFTDVTVTHWILDDGFQHRSLHRDVDIVVVDVRSPWGRCLPAGLFREGKGSLSRANIVVLTKAQTQNDSARVKNEILGINQIGRAHV